MDPEDCRMSGKGPSTLIHLVETVIVRAHVVDFVLEDDEIYARYCRFAHLTTLRGRFFSKTFPPSGLVAAAPTCVREYTNGPSAGQRTSREVAGLSLFACAYRCRRDAGSYNGIKERKRRHRRGAATAASGGFPYD